MRLFPSQKQWNRYSLPTKMSFVGALASSLATVFAFLSLFWGTHRPTGDIKGKIEQLDEIKSALAALTSYVDTQQQTLKRLSSEKLELENERDQIQKGVKSTLDPCCKLL